MKKILIGIIAITVLGVLTLIVFKGKGEEPKFRTERVSRGAILSTVTATGTVDRKSVV
jgi:multidrug efflux pump subunit AcrA (membrane-fusion protein)